MHASEREILILSMLGERGFVTFRDLDERLTASAATVRRDLDRLERAGRIVRVHGGARLVESAASLTGTPFERNVRLNQAAKAAIGRAAAALCHRGEAVIIDGGSTTLNMCAHLDGLGLQVLTNSLHIVTALLGQRETRISIPGGVVFREQNIVLSPYEDGVTEHFHASRMFTGAASVGHRGIAQTDVLLVQTGQRFAERADSVVVLVDADKFGAPAPHLVCPLEEIDVLITDARIADATAQMVERAGVELVVADPAD